MGTIITYRKERTMSAETLEDLNSNTLIGYTDKRGTAWWYRAGMQGDEPNHYAGAIPVEDVRRRLFSWEGQEAPVQAVIDGQPVPIEGRKAIVRSDTHATLGIFKDGYRVHQYDEWLIENVATLLDADLRIGSAGLLRGGGVAWVQIEMEDTLDVQGVEYRPFLTAATSMDGTLATTYQTGAQVVVCDNTLSAALGEKDTQRVKIRHSRNSMGRIGEVREALDIVHGVAEDFEAEVQQLLDQKVTEDQWGRFVDAYVGLEQAKEGRGRTIALNKKVTLDSMWSDDERVAPWRGTAWGVISAVNTAVHHEFTVKGDRAERNAERAITGKVHEQGIKTLQLLAQV